MYRAQRLPSNGVYPLADRVSRFPPTWASLLPTGGAPTRADVPAMPPANKSFKMCAIDVFTFGDDGMNTEHYGVPDVAGTMTQLG